MKYTTKHSIGDMSIERTVDLSERIDAAIAAVDARITARGDAPFDYRRPSILADLAASLEARSSDEEFLPIIRAVAKKFDISVYDVLDLTDHLPRSVFFSRAPTPSRDEIMAEISKMQARLCDLVSLMEGAK